MKTRSIHALLCGLMLWLLALPVLAGPPLLCHPFDTGGASSLPWQGPIWHARESDYDLNHLVADSEALLTAQTPVIVRMETLRRAALYAGRDSRVAAHLLARLQVRAAKATTGEAAALARFDAGYFAETLREVPLLLEYRMPGADGIDAKALRKVVANVDGYAMIQQSLAQRGADPAMEFAAALVSASHDRDAAYAQHVRKARAGAARDALLVRNLGQIARN